MNILAPDSVPAAGTCCRFIVESAEQAATLIRERLGENARVLSVRAVKSSGWRRLISAPKLEVIAQVEPSAEEAAQAAKVEVAVTEPVRMPEPLVRRLQSETATSLPGLLRRSGYSDTVLRRLENSSDWTTIVAAPLHRGLVEVGRQLCDQIESRPSRPPLTRAAFLGAPGVGRSTALCKWLASEVFRRARLGHVVTAEFDRPNSTGPLPVFCEALGVPLAHYPANTEPAVAGGFVYFDLPGISLCHPEDNTQIASFLERERITERVLVLNAAYESTALRRALAVGRELNATHVIFTHLDETPQWGRLWDYLLESDLEPLFFSTGPSLTGDFESEPAQALARRSLPLTD